VADHLITGARVGMASARPSLELSVVLPCYRSASLAHRSVDRLCDLLDRGTLRYEVVVVDDGGRDFLPGAFADYPHVRLVELARNCGKGAAVRAGMLAARGDVRVFTDVDLPYDLDLILVMVGCVRESGYHMVIGDRTLPGSTYTTDISFRRSLASALFSDFVGRIVTGGYFDTQCGLKAVRGDIADLVFPMLHVDRFVQLRNNETSTVRLFRDSTRGVVDVLRIKYHQMRGHYQCDALDQLTLDEFQALRARARGQDADVHERPVSGVGV
jgi:dolichyl-phosphate beta-glucosyltransferase